MRAGELDCIHGVGHSAGVHGCDGCCTKLFNYLLDSIKAEAWEEGYAAGSADSYDGRLDADNPYRQGDSE